MPALNTNTSVVDYLKSTGKDSSYGNRANLYKGSGINMGSYQGTAAQNTALLSFLKGGSQSAATPTPAPSPQPNTSGTPSTANTTVTVASPRVDFTNKMTEDLMKQNAGYQTKIDTARNALIDFYKGVESSTDRFNRFRKEQGVANQEELVNALTRQVMDQTDLVEAIPDSVTERTGDFFVTEGDRTAIIAREQQPLVESLTKLLRSKEREEIGLAGKQNLVSQLLSLSMQDDEIRARPLQMGVDYTTADRDTAMSLLTSITGKKIDAFNADQTATDRKQAAETEYQRTLEKLAKQMEFDKEMEKTRQSNRVALKNLGFSQSLQLKDLQKADDAAEQKTEDAWNSILGSADTEYDVWKAIDNNQGTLRSQGVDVDKLWSKHAALAGEVGTGNEFRKSSSSTMFTPEQLAVILGSYPAE